MSAELEQEVVSIFEDRLWHHNGWEARVIKNEDDDGWAFLGDVGNLIVKKKPEFDPRNYGFSKLTPMLKSLTDILEIDERE